MFTYKQEIILDKTNPIFVWILNYLFCIYVIKSKIMCCRSRMLLLTQSIMCWVSNHLCNRAVRFLVCIRWMGAEINAQTWQKVVVVENFDMSNVTQISSKNISVSRGRTEPATEYQQPVTNQQFRCRFRLCHCWLLVWYLVRTEIKDTS